MVPNPRIWTENERVKKAQGSGVGKAWMSEQEDLVVLRENAGEKYMSP